MGEIPRSKEELDNIEDEVISDAESEPEDIREKKKLSSDQIKKITKVLGLNTKDHDWTREQLINYLQDCE